ncbi:MAG: radical SAM protein [Thermodesulfobacteriota bacterium]|nr:radical SAM protein [Thermodesulfobacteriota bacterium]
MKILLIYPQIDSVLGTNHGLASIAGVLNSNGHQFKLLHVSEKYKGIPSNYEIIRLIEMEKPGLIGFSAMTQQMPWIEEQSIAIRKAFPDLVQIIGGVHCTMVPDEVQNTHLFDYICVGEGEYALLELMDALEYGHPTEEIPNLRMWRDGKPVVNKVAPFPDLETLPQLDYSIFDMSAILAQTRGWMGILTSRGCPYKCTYCFNLEIVDQYVKDGAAKSAKDYLRHFPIDIIMDELKNLKREYPQINTFIFDDDLFTLKKQYVQAFCRAYIEHGIDLPFVVNGHVNCFDEKSAAALKKAGCIIVKFGLESGSDRVRREVLRRYMTNKQIEGSFAAAHKNLLHSSAFIMIGLPGETHTELMETLELCAKVKMGRFRWALFFPFPGTASYEIAKPYIDKDKMTGMGNYFDGSCLNFGDGYDLFLDKVGKLCNWYVNALTDWECRPIYEALVHKIEAMDQDTWLMEKDKLVAYDRQLSEDLIEKDVLHYTIRYSNVMGVRSDYIKQEREQIASGEKVRSVTYSLDVG